MDLRAFRELRGLSLQQVCDSIGLASKGHLSDLETGATPWPIKLALEVEVWSRGAVAAVELVNASDALLLRAAIDNAKAAA